MSVHVERPRVNKTEIDQRFEVKLKVSQPLKRLSHFEMSVCLPAPVVCHGPTPSATDKQTLTPEFGTDCRTDEHTNMPSSFPSFFLILFKWRALVFSDICSLRFQFVFLILVHEQVVPVHFSFVCLL